MWPLVDRRKSKRYPVSWQAVLQAAFQGEKATLEVAVVDVSLGGARLETPSLQMGPRHVMADHPERLELEILLPAGLFTAPVQIRWTRYLEDLRKFHVGVSFEDLPGSSLAVLKEELSAVARAS
ncbi:PilZ domain-containing protein [Desulfacinum hydrothermale DSM 13146]|uniref:PilZ domain-containing protein n=1 Tax=Desulfacinum hydrothermale DSM 13146 TaxID=1121390 RepID=A0A1W1XDP3_9BACT|nr:PilZ domain-containing protein [Desulfacinum hydrothermale]SMC22009.1 PilZ domain-containing protein [Desulfacinum hydrothermale DSM 13146]